MKLSLHVPVGAILFSLLSAAFCQTPMGPTVSEVVEFKRIVQPGERSTEGLRAQTSPDGSRVFIVTRKAALATDKNRYEIQLLYVSADRLKEGHASAPETVWSVDVAQDSYFIDPAVQQVRWWDERTLVFLARVKDAPMQVYRLDLPTRQLAQLTQESTPVVSYAASSNMRRLVYAAQVPNPPLKEGTAGVVVGNQSFWSVKFGQHDLRFQDRMYRHYVVDVGSAPRALGPAFLERGGDVPRVSISPDGRWALLPRYEPDRTMAWAQRYPLVDELAKKFALSQGSDPLQYFSQPTSYASRRMVAWRLSDGQEQTVVDAPDDALPGSGQERVDRLWQSGGGSVVLAGTFLPISKDQTSASSHVIEYWPDSNRWSIIAKLDGRLADSHPLPDGFAVVDGGRTREFRRLASGEWEEISAPFAPSSDDPTAWRLTFEEALNLPPDVFAVGPTNQRIRLTTLNPQFHAESWGEMQPRSWRDASGRRWDGGLMIPSAGLDRRRRYPLVVQAYNHSPTNFYLDGPNQPDGATSAFPGRAFMREGVLVMAMPWRPAKEEKVDGRQAVGRFVEGVRGGVDSLVKAGIVDPDRVGIIGWSATGERVLNLVTFSDMPIRAATLADGDANTFFSLTLTYGTLDSTWKRKEALNRGLPFGATLDTWVANDPALHTDCVRAALRIETYGPTVLNNWDLYAMLRRQYKPVEMVVIPGGAHALSIPSERMVSLQGNVDWYRFWLKGETRSEVVLPGETTTSLQAQYVAWRQMETMKASNDKLPACRRENNRG